MYNLSLWYSCLSVFLSLCLSSVSVKNDLSSPMLVLSQLPFTFCFVLRSKSTQKENPSSNLKFKLRFLAQLFFDRKISCLLCHWLHGNVYSIKFVCAFKKCNFASCKCHYNLFLQYLWKRDFSSNATTKDKTGYDYRNF